MKNKVILLVEDNPDDVLLTERALQRNKIANKIVVAEDGIEALDYLFGMGKYTGRDINQLPQLVLLDLRMPKLDGIEVLHRIRADERMKQLPVVILTSSQADIDRVESFQLGVINYMMKPVDLAGLTEVVKQLNLCWLVLNHKPGDESQILKPV